MLGDPEDDVSRLLRLRAEEVGVPESMIEHARLIGHVLRYERALQFVAEPTLGRKASETLEDHLANFTPGELRELCRRMIASAELALHPLRPWDQPRVVPTQDQA